MRSLMTLVTVTLVCLLASDARSQQAAPDGVRSERPDEAPNQLTEINGFQRLGPLTLHGNEADTLTLGVGVFDYRHNTLAAGTVEYRFGRKLFFLGLALGMLGNTSGGFMGYAGAYADLSYRNFYLTPLMAFGGYREGNESPGSVFQFRLSGDLTYRFANGMRLGFRYAHISNANTDDPNLGEDEIYLVYSIPLGPFL
jgi:lipid A 3-O-deacylase